MPSHLVASEGVNCPWNWTVLASPGERSGKLVHGLGSNLPIPSPRARSCQLGLEWAWRGGEFGSRVLPPGAPGPGLQWELLTGMACLLQEGRGRAQAESNLTYPVTSGAQACLPPDAVSGRSHHLLGLFDPEAVWFPESKPPASTRFLSLPDERLALPGRVRSSGEKERRHFLCLSGSSCSNSCHLSLAPSE